MEFSHNSSACNRDCCHFVEQPDREYSYVCLVCNRDRDLSKSSDDGLAHFLALFLIGIIVAFLLSTAF